MWNVELKRGDSSTWRILCDGANHLRHITRWVIGDGSKIDILRHAWIRDLPLDRWPTFLNTNESSLCRLKDLLSDSNSWDASRVHALFGPSLAETILEIPLNMENEDTIELNTQFSGRSTTSLAYSMKFPNLETSRFSFLKCLKDQPRVQFLWWRISLNVVPTRRWLASHHLTNDCSCPWGCSNDEDIEHLATSCSQVQNLFQIFNSWGICLPRFSTLEAIFTSFSSTSHDLIMQSQFYCLMVYHLWRNRNDKVHGNPTSTPSVLAATIISTFAHIYPLSILKQWNTAQSSRLISNPSWCPPPFRLGKGECGRSSFFKSASGSWFCVS